MSIVFNPLTGNLDFATDVLLKSVGVSVPTGLTVDNSPLVESGTIEIDLETGYSIPTDESQGQWNQAYSDRLKWDGGTSGLDAAQGKSSLGLHLVASTGSYNNLTDKPDLALKADLVNGKVASSQIPAIAISDFLGNSADQAAMLALSGQRGDWTIRLDRSRAFILIAEDATQAGNWVELPTPADAISSVNGLTGVVVLGPSDIGAATAQQGAKADTAVQPATLAPVATSGSYTSLTNKPTLGTAAPLDVAATGDATSSQVVKGNDSRLTDSRTPTAHNQAASTITGLSPVATSGAYADLSGKPGLSAVATSGTYTDLTGRPALGTAAPLDVPVTGDASATQVVKGNDSRLSDARTPAAHNQAASTITGLASVATSGAYGDLSNRPTLGTSAQLNVASSGNASANEVVKGNDTRLTDSRTPTAHTHTASAISDSSIAGRALLTAQNAGEQRTSLGLGTAATTNASDYATSAQGQKADTAIQPSALTSALQSKADLVNGVIPTSQIPAIAISEYLGTVSTQAQMLALVGQRGDWAIRSDKSTTFILGGDDASVLSNWIELPATPGSITSVNGQTGVVVLGAANVGAATSAQGAKADTAVQPSSLATVATSGSYQDLNNKPTLGTAASRDVAASGNASSSQIVKGDDSRLVDARTPLTHTHVAADITGLVTSSSMTMSTGKILGRSSAGSGSIEEITLSSTMSMSNGTLTTYGYIGGAIIPGNATFTKPTNTKLLRILMVGGGGGGASGCAATKSDAGSSGGGAGGAVVDMVISGNSLGSVILGNAGIGGAGGAAVTKTGTGADGVTAGLDGSAGGVTTFGPFSAGGGGGGQYDNKAGDLSAGGAPDGPPSFSYDNKGGGYTFTSNTYPFQQFSGPGGCGQATDGAPAAVDAPAIARTVPAGGGYGGTPGTGTAPTNGGKGGDTGMVYNVDTSLQKLGGQGGVVSTTTASVRNGNAGAGWVAANGLPHGAGGGGGAGAYIASGVIAAGTGGAGGYPGGGGGGGGSARTGANTAANTATSGAGGTGASGLVVVLAYG